MDRYNLSVVEYHYQDHVVYDSKMVIEPNGQWARWEDYQALQAELDRHNEGIDWFPREG